MAKYCVGCGSPVNEKDRHCIKCGRETFDAQPRIHSTSSGTSGAKVAAIAIVSLLIVAGVGYYIASNANTAWVCVYVHSTHITQPVEMFAFIDGDQVLHANNVTPGSYRYTAHYQKVSFPLWNDSTTIEVKAVSQGGGLGSQYDSKIVVVQKGQYYDVHLYV